MQVRTTADESDERRDRMRRNRRASVSRARGGGSAARARPRGHALHFRKGNRHARDVEPSGISFRKIADRRTAVAVFAGDRAFHAAVSTRACPRLPRIYRKFKPHVVLGMGGFTSTAPVLAGRMRGDADFHSRIERHSRKSESHDRADGSRRLARVQGMRAVFSESANGSDRHADPHGTAADRSQRSAAETRLARRFAHACSSWAEARARAESIRR